MLARSGLALVLSLLGAHAAYAQPAGATTYGKRGTMEVEVGVGVGYPLTVPDQGSSQGGDFNVVFAPAFRYFLLDGLAIGATVRVGYFGFPSSGMGGTGVAGLTLFQLAPGLEYNRRLGGKLFGYVGAGIGFEYYTGNSCVPTPALCTFKVDFSDTALLLDFGAGVKIPVAPHLVVGVGLDVPMSFHSHEAFYYFNLLGRLAYTF